MERVGMGIFLAAVSVLDILAGLAFLFPDFFGQEFIFWVATLMLVKGIFSVGGSVLSGFFLDFLGGIDLAAGVMLLAGISFPLFWLAPFLKGLFSFVSGLLT